MDKDTGINLSLLNSFSMSEKIMNFGVKDGRRLVEEKYADVSLPGTAIVLPSKSSIELYV